MRLTAIYRWVFAAAILLACASAGRAQTLFESLVLPGPVIEGHAKVEADCGKCHDPGSRKSQPKLCLECHKDQAADIAGARGFHGRDRNAAASDCKHCHTDHKGRTADVVQLDRETFNHTLTNFELKGAHASARCGGCHAAGVKFRKAPGPCVECHKQVEPHKGNLGTACQGCHNETNWRKTKPFDHGTTKFPLTGAHKEVACTGCHAGERYKGVGRTCVTCHAVQDKHGGRYGLKCEACHAPSKWATIAFDHAKATKFPLRGKHATITCDTCHTGDLYRDKLATQCVACHGKADPHKGQLGKRCESCHKETGWRQKVAFDHELTRFPLVGLHGAVACEECHRTPQFKDAPQACDKCHPDKHHEGRLGPQCERCHNPNGWGLWRFDHDRETKFPLTGAHHGLDCHSCHKTKTTGRIEVSKECVACHSNDDAHGGSFGRVCEKCHNTTAFRQHGTRP